MIKNRLFHIITAAVLITIWGSIPHVSEGRIVKKIDKDGTISLHNVPDSGKKTEGRPAKAVLTSKFDGLIEEIAGTEGVDPHLVKCIVKVESDFNPDAISVAGAMGLMQLMDETAQMYQCSDPFDPAMNLRAGIKHFKGLMNYFKQDVPLSLAAYHAGLGRVKKKMAIPPIKSTVDYVNSVMYLYSGKSDYGAAVRKLYRAINKDGSILLYTK